MKTIGLFIFAALVVGAGAWFYMNGTLTGNGSTENNTEWTNSDVPNSAEGAPEGSIHNLPLPEAVAAVRAQVAAEAGLNTNQVLIETAFEREWSDSCLGLGGPAESCLQVITPGYEVTTSVNGEQRVFRTNADGSVVREER